MLVFLGGALWSLLLNRWWAALACVVAFVIAAVVIGRMSSVDHQESSGDSIVFL
jgi:hypothetical protein